MNRLTRTSLLFTVLLVLFACSFPPTQTPLFPTLTLQVGTENGATTFAQVGEVIKYIYTVKNTGLTPLAGKVTVTDAPRQPNCPETNTVGNLDNFLDGNGSETIVCRADYPISQSDFNTGSVVSLATATAGGQISAAASFTLTRSATPQPTGVLTLSKSASPQTYSQVGQIITYSYVITNVGAAPLGPDQFRITDNKLGAAFACGPANTTIAPSQPLNCSAQYVITQADITAGSVTNSATASGAAQTSAAASATITYSAGPTVTPTPSQPVVSGTCSASLPTGSTCQHQVAVGEWLIQIARCYGVAWQSLRDANPQIGDPNFILPSMRLTVRNTGSAGRNYGPPCVEFYTVRSGDTWASIAQTFNADVVVLQKVNPGGLVGSIKIPRNSAGSVPAAVTPGPGPITPVPGGPAQRITFEPGRTSSSTIGLINPGQNIQFLLSAAVGQVLSVQLIAPANEVAIGVNGPTGIALKPLDATPTWSTTVTNAGEHLITLSSIAGNTSKSYTLTVSLTTPGPTATPTSTPNPTATATNTPGP